jgi:hypothetical protein
VQHLPWHTSPRLLGRLSLGLFSPHTLIDLSVKCTQRVCLVPGHLIAVSAMTSKRLNWHDTVKEGLGALGMTPSGHREIPALGVRSGGPLQAGAVYLGPPSQTFGAWIRNLCIYPGLAQRHHLGTPSVAASKRDTGLYSGVLLNIERHRRFDA